MKIKVFITGSSDGLGLKSAQMLYEMGHEVVLHVRNEQREKETAEKFEYKVKILVADLSNFDEVKKLAQEVNALGAFDTIIHNAGVFNVPNNIIFKVNVLAPYILTALIKKPNKLIYIGSNMHSQGNIDIKNLSLHTGVDYSTSKLYILMLALAVARRYKTLHVNVVDPGWVKTKMANYQAPDSIEEGSSTQVWLASQTVINFSGKYFYHKKEAHYSSKANNIELQEKLINKLKELTGVEA